MSVLARKLRRDFARNRRQFLAVAATVFVGVTLFGASYDAYRSLEASYTELYDRLGFADLWVTGGDVDAIAARARELDGVAAVETRHRAEVPLRIGDQRLVARLVGLPDGSGADVNDVMVLEGRRPARDGAAGGGGAASILVERHLADHHALAPGDELTLDVSGTPTPVTVRGVVSSPEYLWPAASRQEIFSTPEEFGVLFADDAAVAQLAGDRATRQAVIRYAPGADGERLDRRLRDLAAEEGAVDLFTEEEQPSNSLLQQDVRGFGELAFLFPALFLTAAGLGTWVLLTRLVVSQRSIIGGLMAEGMPRRRIFGHYLGYGLVAGLGGAIPGVVAGALAAWAIAGTYTDAIDVPITVVAVDATAPAVGLAFAAVAGALAALAPAIRATRLLPAEAMRGPVPTGPGHPGLLERILPPLRRLPSGAKLVMRQTVRDPRRAATTVLGVVLALVLILTSAGMLDTVDVLLERQFDRIQLADARVAFRGSVGTDEVAALEAVPGVADAEPLVALDVALVSGGQRYGTRLVGFREGTDMHRFLTPDGETRLPGDGLLLGDDARDLLGVGVGDQITVQVPSTGATVSDTVRGFVDEPIGTLAYASIGHLRDVAPDLEPSAASLRLADGVSVGELRSELIAIEGAAGVEDTHALEDLFRDFLALFYAFVGVMLAFGGLLGFALIFNAMSVNLAQRTVEVATLRAAGVGHRRIARWLTAENLVLTAVALAPGLLLGWWLAGVFLGAYGNDQFAFELHLRARTMALAAGFVVVVTLLSAWPGLRAVRRTDIAEVVRERAL